MFKSNQDKPDIIDEDLYEEIDQDELLEILEEEKRKVLEKEKQEKEPKTKRPFPKWIFWLIAFAMVIQVIAVIPRTFSIPAIDFLITSTKLYNDPVIQEYRESVVVIEGDDNKGTGFSISVDGRILTNYHVIEDQTQLSVGYPEDGLFQATVEETYPNIDLAVLKVEGDNLPFLTLAKETTFENNEAINFIGNPLQFNGIANEGKIIGYQELDSWEMPVLMLNAPVYRGNSGSPVINKAGEVIAVIFATQNNDTHGKVGLAVPIDYYYQMNEE